MIHTNYIRNDNDAHKTAYLTCDLCGRESTRVSVDAAKDLDEWEMGRIRPRAWSTYLAGRMQRDCCPSCLPPELA